MFLYFLRFGKWRFNKFFLLFSNGSGNLVIQIHHFGSISEHIGQAGELYQKVLYQAIDKGDFLVFDFGHHVLDCHNFFVFYPNKKSFKVGIYPGKNFTFVKRGTSSLPLNSKKGKKVQNYRFFDMSGLHPPPLFF